MEVEISNIALSLIGQTPITSLDAANNISRTVKTHYALSRDWVTMQREWRDAVKRVALDTPYVEAPPFGYSSQYEVPDDCLRIIEVRESNTPSEENSINPTKWDFEGGMILANCDSGIKVKYLSRFADDIPVHLMDVIALELARRICIPITSSNTMLQTLTARMFGSGGGDKGLLGEAAAVDGMQGRTKILRANRLEAARYGVHGVING